jgi:adenylosuccinate synthase
MINDADGIYLTRADCVQDWPMNVCVAYQFDGQTIMEVPLKLEKAKPVYGDKTYSWRLWDGSRDLSDPLRNDRAAIEARESYLAGGFKSLPLGIREFVKDHNEYVGKSILGISIGPRRGQTIKAPVSF